MRDKRLKEMFERELEIPDVVQEKVRETYRQLGADMEQVEKVSYRNYISRMGTRYVKAASVVLFALMLTTTVHAATGGGFQKLSGLFGGDVSRVEQSSVTPKVSSEKSTFKDLDISVERVLGTEELSYVVLKVKRTDGKTFDKNLEYSFQQVGMKGENDMAWEEADGNGSSSHIVIGEGYENEPKVELEESRYTDEGIVIENNGTDEIYLAVVCGYERKEDGVTSYHKGEKCRLRVGRLKGSLNDEEKDCIYGTAEMDFVLDYGECDKKVCEPNRKIKLPKLNSETKYLSAGTLKRVTITPYYIQYERTMTDQEFENDTWDQIYLEMEDGTRIGYDTNKSWLNSENSRGGYGVGSNGEHKNCLMFKDLIDVEHVKAIYFGKTRIEM